MRRVIDGVRAGVATRVPAVVRSSGDRFRGSATAETAVALPALVLLLAAALWAVSAAGAQVRCVDATRLGARALARGEARRSVQVMIARAAPRGATIRLTKDGATSTVAVLAHVRPPLATGLPALSVRAIATSQTER